MVDRNVHVCREQKFLMGSRRSMVSVVFAFAGMAFPVVANASDFSILMYIFFGATVVVALPLFFISYAITKHSESILLKSSIWGSLIALVFTPLNTPGGNGTSSGPPLLDFLVAAFGGDPVYAIGAVKGLLISMPICSGLVALVLWGKQRQGRQAND